MNADLIARLEKAEVGSRVLDLAIERLTNTSTVHDDHLDRFPDHAKPYTTSLDAIVGLIGEKLPGWTWRVEQFSSSRYEAQVETPSGRFLISGDQEVYAMAATAPLALCIALLKALEAQHER